jgi:hypothetical protein
MKTSTYMCILGACLMGVLSVKADTTRTFTDSQGRKLEATFIKLENDTVYIQMPATGQVYALPMSRLSPEDQAVVRTLKPAENAAAATAVATNAKAEEAAKQIDALVVQGIVAANPKLREQDKVEAEKDAKAGKEHKPFTDLKPNPLMSDEQFVRRVYLDIAGRIPNYNETVGFLKETNSSKRAKLIDTLLDDKDAYASNMYNYFAEMLRVKDRNDGGANYVRGLPYIKWLKQELHDDVTWDKMVTAMITADGKVWDNGAAGYLLRDAGMPLDNLANTLSVFLGTDVSCAQCHDHPFADWTQRQFYEMASFFGATTTQLNARDLGGKDPAKRLTAEADEIMTSNGVDPKKYRNLIGNVIRANRYVVADLAENTTKLPHDYKYHDGKPNDPVSPKLITWSAQDLKLPAYQEIAEIEKKAALKKPSSSKAVQATLSKAKGEVNEGLRSSFAKWMTAPSNPRFAMTIANRMWARIMGVGLTQSLKNLDHPEESSNPALLRHLASEMVRVKFDMKEFMRILYNTQTYQREATTTELAMGAPYYFQGPLLRRMSAEQAWDSYMTLVLGADVDKPKSKESDLYGRAVDMDLSNPKLDAKTVLMKVSAVQDLGKKQRDMMKGGGLDKAGKGKDTMMDNKDAADEGDAMVLSYGGMKLMRAAELEQPAPAGHFLREFGQSERLLIDGGLRSGSVPQVLMMMNGNAQNMLTSKDSLIHRTISNFKDPNDKVEAVFLSILNRKATIREQEIANKELASNGDAGFTNMIWALINTREFSFIQ